MRFKDKFLILGITGGIAVYKVASLLRRLVNEEGAEVQVIMTAHAQEFITPLIFETFSRRPVITDMFKGEAVGTRHIDLVKSADAVLICPATANIIAKAAHGIADDMLSTVILVAGSKTCFVPAMNSDMYDNPITQGNLDRLIKLGYGVLEPDVGPLACKASGKGRMPEEDVILSFLDQRLNGKELLKGKKVVVTAGPTRAYIDDVRFITNRSSGKMGYALAEIAHREGADVTLISGPTSIAKPWGVKIVKVETAEEMLNSLLENGRDADYLFMAAAIEDMIPVRSSERKMKKEYGFPAIEVKPADDLLKIYRENYPKTCIIGFSVEFEEGEERSIKKMLQKGIDYIVWNNPAEPGAGFEFDTNAVTLYSKEGRRWRFDLASKREIAEKIIQTVVAEKN